MNEIIVEKNEEDELLVPNVWRPKFKAIIAAFIKQDYNITSEIKNVNPISKETAKQIKEYIKDYGEELIELPKETWDSSVYIYHGSHWNIFIDLYTKEEGLSDLVLNAEIREHNNDYTIDVQLVYVP